MYVYGDITTDARVQRAAETLSQENELVLVSVAHQRELIKSNYENRLVRVRHSGLIGLLESIRSAIRIIKDERPDIVYCHDYYSALLAYYLIVVSYPVKIVYDAHELIIPEEGIKDRRLSFFRWFEQRIVKRVNLLICASSERGQLMRKYYGLTNQPLTIPNVSQLSIQKSEEVNRIMDNLSSFFSQCMPTIVYAGVVTKGRGLDMLVDAVIDLSPKYKLLVVGDGNARQELEQRLDGKEGVKYAFTGKVPYYALGSLLSYCDLGYVYYPNNSLNNRYCASNKVYEYSSILLPMVGNDNPTLKKELEFYGIGIASDNVSEAIEDIMKDQETYKNNCRSYNEKNRWEFYSDFLNIEIGKI